MTDSIDEISQRWKRNPDASSTIALCDALRGSVRTTLVQQVADFAQQTYASNVPVLVAVSRMYMNAHKLAEAQAVLVAAGKVAPRDGQVYRVLGEVLLRRGDADRAEKVLERSAQFGMNDGETKMWIERAKVYKPMQARAGTRAVAAEVARTAPSEPRATMDSFSDVETQVKDVPTMAPSVDGDSGEAPTLMRSEMGLADDSGAAPTLMRDEISLAAARPVSIPPPNAPPRNSPNVPPALPLAEQMKAVSTGPRKFSDQAQTAQAFSTQDIPALPKPPAVPAGMGLPVERPPFEANPLASKAAPAAVEVLPAPAAEKHSAGAPLAQDVLDALALAGVFEPPGKTVSEIKWTRPEDRPRRRALIPLFVATVLLVGGGIGALTYLRKQRVIAHSEAENSLDTVELNLRASQASRLPETEDRFNHIFEIDSRSDRAALDWLHERALSGLLKGGADLAFEENITRAHEVQVPDNRIAFALIASFFFQGDTAGAAALLSKWDAQCADDAWYQLFAAATLERAGDGRARDRYEAATKLDPELIVAHIGLIRATAVDGDPVKAAELAKAFRAKWPDRIEGQALVALAWGRDPARGETPPPEVQETIAKADSLPLGLRAVPHALAAIVAVDKRDYAKTKAEVQAGLLAVETPGIAAWLGVIALDTGDEALARKAALSAVQFSAVYPAARVLAARVALLGDRLDEALKATEELDANSADVAVVRAATAYERGDSAALASALEAVPPDARKLPFLAALNLAQDALAGRATVTADKLLELADDEAPWSDLVAMDLALDTNDLGTADKIADKWKGSESRPLRALRLSRLARYRGKLDDADKLSVTATGQGTMTMRVLMERVLVLVARDKPAEVGPLLAKYPLVLGQASSAWLSALASASNNRVEDARGKTSQLDAPPDTAPVPVRVIAAVSLGAMKDRKRGQDLVKGLFLAGILDPDVVTAGAALGVKPPAPSPPPRKKK